jgi:TusA-related sulfurtransferase
MASSAQLNLIGVVLPFCLLAFKSALAQIEPSQVLEVLVEDPEVADDLVRIVDRSEDRLIGRQKCENHVCIRVQRAGLPCAPA